MRWDRALFFVVLGRDDLFGLVMIFAIIADKLPEVAMGSAN
jgi:hypothetical protein